MPPKDSAKDPGREARLAAALRENLKRRKEASRARLKAAAAAGEKKAEGRPNKARNLD
jgi:hypothetical protein